jgi:hypothetical protein
MTDIISPGDFFCFVFKQKGGGVIMIFRQRGLSLVETSVSSWE